MINLKKYIFIILVVVIFNIFVLDSTNINTIGIIAIDIILCTFLNILISFVNSKMKGKKDEN